MCNTIERTAFYATTIPGLEKGEAAMKYIVRQSKKTSTMLGYAGLALWCMGCTALIMMIAVALYVAAGFFATKSFFRTHILQNIKNAFVPPTHIF